METVPYKRSGRPFATTIENSQDDSQSLAQPTNDTPTELPRRTPRLLSRREDLRYGSY
jgi:hypothetical protein